MARGGMRPTAPQNNPMNVNARGGNGQSGDATQAAKYVPDLPYGEGQALMQTQQASPLAAAPSIEQSGMPSGLASAAASQPVIGLGEKTLNPGQIITAGYDNGPGPDSSILGLMGNKLNEIKDIQMIMKYLPNLDIMYRSPDVPDAFKAWFRTLKGRVDQIMKSQQ
jgi:hypothetical protein